MNKFLSYLLLAGMLVCAGSANAGPNDPHAYPVTASKYQPTHINHIVNSNNRAPVYPMTANAETHVTHHHPKHHAG
jgi:hypothetical protein